MVGLLSFTALEPNSVIQLQVNLEHLGLITDTSSGVSFSLILLFMYFSSLPVFFHPSSVRADPIV